MDQTEVIKIVHKYAEVVQENFEYSRLFLFGSYAKGNFHEDSDIDIAIVFDDFDEHLERQVDLMSLTQNIDTRIEPHPFREKDFEINNPLVYEIMESGMEINRETV